MTVFRSHLREAREEHIPVLDLESMELDDLRPRWTRWANTFTPRYRTLAYVLAHAVDRETSVATRKLETLQMAMQTALDRQKSGAVAPRTRWIRYRLAEMEQAGIIEKWQPRQVVTDRSGQRRFQGLSNRYAVDFTKVIGPNGVEVHDFMAALEPSDPAAQHDNSAASSAASSAALPLLRSSIGRPPDTAMPAADGRFAPNTVGAGPHTPMADDLEPAAREEWSRVLDDLMGLYLGSEVFGSRTIHQPTVESKLDPVLKYLNPDDIAGDFRELLNTDWEEDQASERMAESGNPIGYFLQAFPSWVQENFLTWVERMNGEDLRVAEDLLSLGVSVGMVERRGATWVHVPRNVGMFRDKWLEVLQIADKAAKFRADLEEYKVGEVPGGAPQRSQGGVGGRGASNTIV